MARKLRYCPKGGIFHLCNRAVLKTKMFFSEQEYQEIELVLREALAKFPVSIFAYCIMPNHWHLLGRANEEKAISRFMHWFGTTQSKRWRTANETIGLGAVFQNRFRSHAVVGQNSFLKVAHYIERNPVASNLCKYPGGWPSNLVPALLPGPSPGTTPGLLPGTTPGTKYLKKTEPFSLFSSYILYAEKTSPLSPRRNRSRLQSCRTTIPNVLS